MTDTLELEAALVLGHWNAELGHVATFADLLAVTPFDADDRPPAGTECAQCRQLDHYCPAKGYCGEYPLCLACGGGVACEQLAAIERMHRPSFDDEEMFAPDGDNAPREGRRIEISDADRIVPEERQPVTAWTAKASLDPENLKKGLKSSARAPIRLRGVDREAAAHERMLGRRIEKAKRAAKVKAKIEESVMSDQPKVVRTYAPRVCICGCGESFVPTGVAHKYKEGHKPKAVKKALGGGRRKKIKAAKPGKASALATVAAPVGDAPEMVTVRVPATALDRLILMLPAKLKASAIEKLLGELG